MTSRRALLATLIDVLLAAVVTHEGDDDADGSASTAGVLGSLYRQLSVAAHAAISFQSRGSVASVSVAEDAADCVHSSAASVREFYLL